MSAIRIRKTIDSETLTLPELKPFIGRTVEIVIEEPQVPLDPARKEFWDVASQPTTTQEEFAAQQETFRKWRADPRFEKHWPMLDHMLTLDFDQVRKWAEVLAATWNMEDYDYDALREMDECDVRDQQERFR